MGDRYGHAINLSCRFEQLLIVEISAWESRPCLHCHATTPVTMIQPLQALPARVRGAGFTRSLALPLVVCLATLWGAPLAAQTLTWDGATNDNWSNDPADVNWSGAPWSAGANAVFSPGTFPVDVVDSIVANSLLLDNTITDGVNVTLAGPGSLTINGAANLQLGPFRTGNAAGIGATNLDMSDSIRSPTLPPATFSVSASAPAPRVPTGRARWCRR